MYSLNVASTGQNIRFTSAELLAQLAKIGDPMAKRIADEITHIETHGIRYSNQDFDILSGAFHFVETKGQLTFD